MNQKDRAAEPMSAAFTPRPDYTPYETRPNRIPLTYGLRGDGRAPVTATVPGSAPESTKTIAKKWRWSEHQRFSGERAVLDMANPMQTNRLNWYLGHHWKKPFPGDTAILPQDQVSGRQLPPDDTDG